MRDEKFQPVDDAVVSVTVEPVAFAGATAAAPVRLEAEADPAEPGLYHVTYVAEELEPFARRLPDMRAPVMETWSHPAWHTPWVFSLALACLLAEWGLRRWKGMP